MTHLTIQQLVAQTDGELTGASLMLVEKHIGECEACWHEMEQLAELDTLLASVVSSDPGDAFFDELAANVEAEISGKKKPAPRAAAASVQARPAPAPPASAAPRAFEPPAPAPQPEPEPAPRALESPAPASAPERAPASQPEPEPAPRAFEPPAPPSEPEPAAAPPPGPEPAPRALEPAPAPTPERAPAPPPARARAAFDQPRESEPEILSTQAVGGWIPPTPTPDDPFADLVLPPRSATPPPAPPVKPRPPAPPAAGRGPAPAPPRVHAAPAPKPMAAPVAPVPPRVQAPPAPPVAPEPELESRPKAPIASILIGVFAFIAGLIIAVVITARLLGFGVTLTRPQGSAPTVTSSPGPAETAPEEAPPAAQVETPPAATPAPVVAASPPPRPAPAKRRAPAHAVASKPTPGGTAESGTTVIPVQVIHSETTASAPAAPPTTAPTAPAELGILCGTVLDSDGRAVARAQVMMADVGVVVLTDRAGRFCLTAPAGERTLSVVCLGFSPARRLVSLGKRTPEINITLKSAAPIPIPR